MKAHSLLFVSLFHLFISTASSSGMQILKEYPQFTRVGSMAFQGDILWLGGGEYGVVMLNTVDDTYRYFDRRDGMMDISVRSIAVGTNGIWLSRAHTSWLQSLLMIELR